MESSGSCLMLAAGNTSQILNNHNYTAHLLGSDAGKMTNADCAALLTFGKEFLDDFQYDFAHPAAIDPLDNFLDTYRDQVLLPLPPEKPHSKTTKCGDQVLPRLPPANPRLLSNTITQVIPNQSTHLVLNPILQTAQVLSQFAPPPGIQMFPAPLCRPHRFCQPPMSCLLN